MTSLSSVVPPIRPMHADVSFNAPLSDARAASLIRSLGPLGGRRIVDVGCGWAEFLLRALESAPDATGFGVDSDAGAVGYGREQARRRGLADRVELSVGDAAERAAEIGRQGGADVTVNIGAAHAWGGEVVDHTDNALDALAELVPAGGRLLFGECFWKRRPTEEETAAAASAGLPREQYRRLPDLVDAALGRGFRLLALSEATVDEWDVMENGNAVAWEEWLLANPGSPHAAEVRAVADRHQHFRIRGIREPLGFAYLTLVRG
ncbi:SAM-dependent methyltransferase [Nocardiopsis coralliicola]